VKYKQNRIGYNWLNYNQNNNKNDFLGDLDFSLNFIIKGIIFGSIKFKKKMELLENFKQARKQK
jgi:hypothetical protein